MIYEIKLKIKDYAVLNIYTSFESLKQKLISINNPLTRTIPITSTEISEIKNSDIKYFDSILIQKKDKKFMEYDKKNNFAFLNVNEEELRFPDLTYISLSMFSSILERVDKYLLHSSSLQIDDDKAIVLVGDANAGKTSLAYQLMSRHNSKLISNDHSIIGVEDNKVKVLGGTKEIQMRIGAIELYFPELYEKINLTCDDKWNKKIIVNEYIDDTLILPSDKDKIILSDIYSINTSNTSSSFIRKKDSVDEFLFLYENFSKIIKGTYNYIYGFNYPMPSMENDETLRKLSNMCNLIIENSNVFASKGSVSELAKTMVKRNE